MSLAQRFTQLQQEKGDEWAVTGQGARPNLHSIIRYPAMMVPSMQGDILDILMSSIGTDCRVIDPFVGSGTILTEAILRGLNFQGCDINPLAVLTCEAKIAADAGVDLESATLTVLECLRVDHSSTVDVDFPGLSKWFTQETAQELSRIRRAVMAVDDLFTRKLMWTVFAETIRISSNSRTSTYKLHRRNDNDVFQAGYVVPTFQEKLSSTLSKTRHFRRLTERRGRRPSALVLCTDVRTVNFERDSGEHAIVITSPPYGDNQTTIPYGQFSYLALCWIPAADLPRDPEPLVSSTHALDHLSLGGSLKGAEARVNAIKGVSPSLDALLDRSNGGSIDSDLRKVASFMADFYNSLRHLREQVPGESHWVFTTGNRRAAGRLIPFDKICKEMMCYLGGEPITTLHRVLPTKRMPSKNNMGLMINSENTLVVEFK